MRALTPLGLGVSTLRHAFSTRTTQTSLAWAQKAGAVVAAPHAVALCIVAKRADAGAAGTASEKNLVFGKCIKRVRDLKIGVAQIFKNIL